VSNDAQAENSSPRLRKGTWRKTSDKALILFLAVLAVSAIPLVHDAEVQLTDTFFRLAPAPHQPSKVILVLIDEESLREYGRWPWPRTLLAGLNNNLAGAGAAVIGLDILLAEPQSAAADRPLAESFRSTGRNVIVDKIGTLPEGPRWVEPLPDFARSAAVGHAQAIIDSDGVCRRFPPQELTLDGPRWAFAIELARRVDLKRAEEFLAARGLKTHDNARVSIVSPRLVRIPFRRNGFETVSAAAILERKELTKVAGKPVIIGFGPVEIGDRVPTPLHRDIPTPGAEVHAQILDGILSGRTLRDAPLVFSAALLGLTCLLVIAISQRWRGIAGWLSLIILAIGAYGLGFIGYAVAGLMLPSGTLILATILGPLFVYAADFVEVERNVTRQLQTLRVWLRAHRAEEQIKGQLSWRLQLLQELQLQLGALYELHQALLESTRDLVAIFDQRGHLLLKNQLFAAACSDEITLDQFRARMVAKAEGEVYLDNELFSLRLVPLLPTLIAPQGGTIVTMTSLRTREERDRARAEALAFVTHELRTPLTSIQGFAQLMQQYPASPTFLSAPATIERESRRLLAMINSYLNVLRLDAGAQPLQMTAIDLCDAVKQVFEILQPLADANGMQLRFSGEHQPASVIGDSALITGAILNLVSNAIKYGKQGTAIQVSWREQNNGTVIAVQNQSGTDLSQDRHRLFELYYREPQAERVASGWGLGLAFVKRIAEKHGGFVTVEDHSGTTTFEIHHPLRTATVALAKEVAS
jgi:signal transduction histidine kinase